MMPTRPCVDQSALDEVTGGDRDLEQRLFEYFVQVSGADATELGHAAALGQREQVARAAHRLRGASSTLGASDLAAACLHLEQSACDGDIDAIASSVAEIEEQLRRVVDYISKADDAH
jgi:HPt (histidine-containing phosphotransfer) domain-containing protein